MGIYIKNGKVFIEWRIQGKKKRELVGPMSKVSKKQAKKLLEIRKSETTQGKWDYFVSGKIYFREFIVRYIEEYSVLNKQSWQRDITSSKSLVAFFGDMYLSEITPRLIDKYKTKRMNQKVRKGKKVLDKNVSAATINRELALLKHCFTIASQWNLLSNGYNPVKSVRFFSENNTRVKYLTEEQYEKLMSELSPLQVYICSIAANTGLRENEILQLRWQNVDFSSKTITIENQKNGEKSFLPVSSNVIDLLAGWKAGNGNGEFVFTNPKTGKPYTRVDNGFRRACKRAEIEDFRFHDLRHHFASWLAMSGVDLFRLKELMRHKKIDMTLRYAHLSDKAKREAVELLGNKFSIPSSDRNS